MKRPTPAEVRRHYAQIASSYDGRHASAVSVKRFAAIDAPQLAAARGARRVLELGVGTGRLLGQARAPVRVGLDLALPMLRRARARDLLVACGDAHQLPFADGSFDAILAGKGVFRYLDPEPALAECSRVLADGGRLAVHQYAAHTWSLRGLFRKPAKDSMHLGHIDDLVVPARRSGLLCQKVYLWRSIRVPPYLLRIPVNLPGRFWNHCTLVFRKTAQENEIAPALNGPARVPH